MRCGCDLSACFGNASLKPFALVSLPVNTDSCAGRMRHQTPSHGHESLIQARSGGVVLASAAHAAIVILHLQDSLKFCDVLREAATCRAHDTRPAVSCGGLSYS